MNINFQSHININGDGTCR